MESSLVKPEIQFLVLLTVAAGIALAVKYVRFPYTIALVIGGLAVGLTGVEPYHLTEELILFVFLPPLLFEGAIHFELLHLRRNLRSIAVLALPGLLVAGFLAGLAISWITGLPLAVAILAGFMITPTDPISVLALFKKLGVSKRLSMIVEGESVFNDGTGIVLYGVLVGIVTSGSFSVGPTILIFLKVVAGGLMVGVLLGYLAFLVLKRVDDHVLEVLVTLLLAYGAFIVAEHSLHVSGVMAVVAAGVLVGNQGARLAMSPTTRISIRNFWEIAAFLINSLIFLMIGTQIHVTDLFGIWPYILAVFVAVTLARSAGCYPLLWGLNLGGEGIPTRWMHVINWGGIHGSIPIALALGLPSLPQRDFVVNLVFGVVFLSLTVQGLTMGPLIRALGLGRRQEEQELYERSVARSVALRAAMDDLGRKRDEGRVSARIHDRLLSELEGELKLVVARMDELEGAPGVQNDMENRARHSLLLRQKSTLQDLMVEGSVSSESTEELIRDIDRQLEEMEGKIKEGGN